MSAGTSAVHTVVMFDIKEMCFSIKRIHCSKVLIPFGPAYNLLNLLQGFNYSHLICLVLETGAHTGVTKSIKSFSGDFKNNFELRLKFDYCVVTEKVVNGDAHCICIFMN